MERKYTPHELWDIYMRGKPPKKGIDTVYFYCCPYDKSEDIYMGYKEDLETRFKDDVKRLGINNELDIIKQKS